MNVPYSERWDEEDEIGKENGRNVPDLVEGAPAMEAVHDRAGRRPVRRCSQPRERAAQIARLKEPLRVIRHDLLAGDDRPETAVGERGARIFLERSHEHGRPRGLPQIVVARQRRTRNRGGARRRARGHDSSCRSCRGAPDSPRRGDAGRRPRTVSRFERPVGRAVVERDHRDALVLEREHGLDHRSDELLAPVHRKPDHDACGLGLVRM